MKSTQKLSMVFAVVVYIGLALPCASAQEDTLIIYPPYLSFTALSGGEIISVIFTQPSKGGVAVGMGKAGVLMRGHLSLLPITANNRLRLGISAATGLGFDEFERSFLVTGPELASSFYLGSSNPLYIEIRGFTRFGTEWVKEEKQRRLQPQYGFDPGGAVSVEYNILRLTARNRVNYTFRSLMGFGWSAKTGGYLQLGIIFMPTDPNNSS